MPSRPLIVDAHLDLAWNVLRGRDVTRPAAEQPRVQNETATVGLPDLERGNVGVVCATLFSLPKGPDWGGYTDHVGAAEQAGVQLGTYTTWERDNCLQIVRSADDLDAPGLRAIVLMEGADPMALPGENEEATPVAWFDRGVRMAGLAWQGTRWAGGTSSPGPLTDDGRRLVPLLDSAGYIHDASHLAEASLDDLLDLATRPICATHSNCRVLVDDDPGGRHLPDRQIQAITDRGGVIGINLFSKFLLPAAEYGQRLATLDDVVNHIRHVCDLVGDCDHVGLGTDMDGGFGRELIPREIETSADLPKVGEALANAGFTDDQVAAVLSENWMRFFRRSLA